MCAEDTRQACRWPAQQRPCRYSEMQSVPAQKQQVSRLAGRSFSGTSRRPRRARLMRRATMLFWLALCPFGVRRRDSRRCLAPTTRKRTGRGHCAEDILRLARSKLQCLAIYLLGRSEGSRGISAPRFTQHIVYCQAARDASSVCKPVNFTHREYTSPIFTAFL